MDPGGLGPASPGTPGTTDPGFDPGMDPGGLGPANPGTPGTTDPGFDPGMDPGGLGPAEADSSGGDNGGGDGGGDEEPVILDLDGDGLSIVQRDASTMTYDMAGDGLQHRTAWVGKGDGVLAIDANGDGRIDQRSEIIFTDWDPGAGSDMKALRSVFDTNHNGRLDAGDARFADFRVVVDGQVRTLAELGIVSIDLVADGAPRRYADGSTIEGRSTFTRADGSTGTAADASFVSDANGWRMDRTSVTGADGRRTDTLTARAVDGTLVSQTVSVTSADGSETTTSFDDDGDGLVDRRQATSDTTAAGGRVTVVRFYDRQGALRGSISTARYNAGTLEIVELDRDGDGRADQGQRYEALADGSSATTVTALNPDGTIRAVQRTTVSADGLDRVVTEAPVGQAVVTTTRTLTAYAADGTRTDTATVANADGTLRAGAVTVTSADGRTKSVASDRDGSGGADLVQESVLTTDADGRIRSVVTTRAQDATLLARTTTLSSADGLSTETFLDETGADRTSTRILATRATDGAGATTRTSEVFNADGSRRSWQSETVSADQHALTRLVDADGDGISETTLTMTTAADGRRTTVTQETNADQSLRSRTTRVTQADGLDWTETSDSDGDRADDREVRFTTNFNADHSLIETTRVLARDGTELSRKEAWTSADRNTTTVTTFVGAGSTRVAAVTTERSLAADGTLTETVTTRRGAGILANRAVTTTSADRQTVTVKADTDGDTATDSEIETRRTASGAVTTTVNTFSPQHGLVRREVTDTSADGQTVTRSSDLQGRGTAIDRVDTTTTAYGADGSTTVTARHASGDGTAIDWRRSVTSDDGLQVTTTWGRGTGPLDGRTVSTTVLNANGSRTTTERRDSRNGTALALATTTVSGNGLRTETVADPGATGVARRTVREDSLADDGARSTLTTVQSQSGAALSRMASTVWNGGWRALLTADVDGDGRADWSRETTRDAGGVVTTVAKTMDAGGAVKGTSTLVTSRNGFRTEVSRSGTEAGTLGGTHSETVVLGADGSRTVMTVDSAVSGETQVRSDGVSGDGLVEGHAVSLGGQALAEWTTVTRLGDDGGRTTDTARYATAWRAARRVTETVAADGVTRRLVVTRDGQTDTSDTARRADGSLVTTIVDGETDPARASSSVTVVSANGLASSRMRYAGPALALSATETWATTLLDNGSVRVARELDAADGTKQEQSLVETSADGLIRASWFDATGRGWTRVEHDTTLLGDDGSTTRTVTGKSGDDSVLRDEITAWTAGNGRSWTLSWTLPDRARSLETQSFALVEATDGTSRSTKTSRQGDAVLETRTTDVSADGRTATVQVDAAGQQRLTLVARHEDWGDGSTLDTSERLHGTQRVDFTSRRASAEGRTVATTRDVDGNGTVDQTELRETLLDGSQRTTTTTQQVRFGATSLAVRSDSDDGLFVRTTFDDNADGVVDRTRTQLSRQHLDGAGFTTLEDRAADGTFLGRIETTVAADGRLITVRRFERGSLQASTVETTRILADGSRTVTTQTLDAAGTTVETRTAVISATGLTTTTATTASVDKGARTGRLDTHIDGSIDGVEDETDAGGQPVHRVLTSIGADGLGKTVTTQSATGSLETVETTTVRADGSTVVVLDTYEGATLKDRTTTTTSADRQWVLVEIDAGADGTIDRTIRSTPVAGRGLSVAGSAGADSLAGTAGLDTLAGDAGDDTLEGGWGADSLSGGAGCDLASYEDAREGTRASLADASQNSGDAAGDSYSGIEGLIGSSYADTLTGDGAANILVGGKGDDRLEGGAGNDTIDGGDGQDTVWFSGRRADYQVTADPSGWLVVRDLRAGSPDGTDVVKNAESLQFADRSTQPGSVDHAPASLTLSVAHVAENAAAGTVVGRLNGQDPDDWSVLTYSLLNDAGGRFMVDAATGVVTLRTAGTLDYETWASHTITAMVTDQTGAWTRQDFAIAVDNVNETPVGARFAAGGFVWENSGTWTWVGRLTGIDPDAGDRWTYALLDDGGGRFTINASTGDVFVGWNTNIDYEASHAYWFKVRTTDSGGLSNDSWQSVAVGNVNEAPINPVWQWYYSCPGSLLGTLIGRVNASDPENENVHFANSALTYAQGYYVDDQGYVYLRRSSQVLIQGGRNNIDRLITNPTGETVSFQAIDSSGNILEANLKIYSNLYPYTSLYYDPVVLDLNGDGFNPISLDRSTRTLVVDDRLRHTGWIAGGDGILAFDKNQDGLIDRLEEVSFLTPELPGATDLQVLKAVFDTNGNWLLDPGDKDWGQFRLVVDDTVLTLNEAGIASIGLSSTASDRLLADGSMMLAKGVFTRANGTTGATQQITILVDTARVVIKGTAAPDRLVSTSGGEDFFGGAGADFFVFRYGFGTDVIEDFQSTGRDHDVLAFQDGAFNSWQDFKLTLSQIGTDVLISKSSIDEILLRNTKLSDIGIHNVIIEGSLRNTPERIVITGGSIAPESILPGTVIARVSAAFDARSAANRFSLADDGGLLQIDPVTGDITLRAGASLDFETRPALAFSVAATDDTGLSTSATFKIAVTDVNEAPGDLRFTPTVLPENSGAGTLAGTLAGSDPDTGSVLRYSLVDDAGGRFAVDPVTGVIVVKPGAVLDYEATPTVALTARVTDLGGLAYQKVVQIALTNVAGTVTGMAGNDSLAETPEEDVIQGAGGNDTVRGGAGNDTIDGGQGTDTVAYAGKRSDYLVRQDAVTKAFVITDLRAGAPDGVDRVTAVETFAFADRTLTAVTVLNNAPSGLALRAAALAENSAAGTVVGSLSGMDPDAGALLRYGLVADGGGRFAVNAVTGAITVKAGAVLDYEATRTLAITARVTDQGGLSFDKAFTVTLGNVNEAPTALTLTGRTIAENSAAGAVVGTLRATDPDAGASLRYSLVADGGGRFAVNAATGAVMVKAGAALDYEATRTLAITARVTDQGGLAFDKTFTVGLTNVSGTVKGTSGNDSLAGTPEEDTIQGFAGNDSLSGGLGNDTLDAGDGDDSLSGGRGADIFVFRGHPGADVVSDFVSTGAGHDVLQIDPRLVSDWTTLLSSTRQNGSDLRITLSPTDSITLKNVTLASFAQDDVRFAA